MTVLAGSGMSRLDNAHQAGQAAAQQALLALHGRHPRLVIAFTGATCDQAEVARGIRSVTSDATLIGCGAGGIISTEGPFDEGVVVLAMHSDDLDAWVAVEEGMRDHPALAGQRVAEQLENNLPLPQNGKRATALVLADGLSGTLAEVVQSATTTLGPLCPLVGGGAGNLTPNQFVNEQTYNDAISMALITTAAPISIGVHHGWMPAGRGLVVTRSQRNVVYELGGRSAFEAYVELFPQENLTTDTLFEFARIHPLGLPQANGEFLVRDPVRTYADGSMECAATVPENVVAHIMEADPSTLSIAAEVATRRAVEQLEGRPIAALLVFNCVTRRVMLGQAVTAELDLIRDIVGHDTPIAGMFCYGEIAPGVIGPSTFHNKTVAVCAIGKE